ncbi:unnamed protein product [Eruca vesicaria subsp. sativa]|uniref:Uncharacterized protein n=1 Tax=Eruca vesicaria subsp. sativa TaxID=29727 RepID=A0ABC8LKA6_ERUVS|nr:unnamed protein product [Eruca vesicaria subsp. sativa]
MRSDRRYSDAYDLFHHYSSKCKSDLITNLCSSPIIIALCDEGKLDKALELYKYLLRDPRPSYHAKLALALDEAIDKFYCVDRSVYGIFIRGFLDLGNLERANQLFQELKLSDDADAVVQARAMFMEHWFKQEMDEEKAMECYYLSSKKDIYGTAEKCRFKSVDKMLEQSKYYLGKFDSDSCNIMVNEKKNVMVNECFKLEKISEAVEIFRKSIGT